ncbi:MAG: dUTP diphosphatase [Desulfatibacillaceae bacterium]|nr:dUTP diphosphatase [Desulfatibacillaceae bacterium]
MPCEPSEAVVRIKRLRPETDSDIPLPGYMSEQAAGMDVAAAIENPLTLEPGGIALVPTGFALAIEPGHEIQVRPRSGLAIKHGISIPNAPGTIDADYRGEVMVALINLSQKPYTLQRGDRIAQLVLARVYRARLVPSDELDKTERDSGGFGSTG